MNVVINVFAKWIISKGFMLAFSHLAIPELLDNPSGYSLGIYSITTIFFVTLFSWPLQMNMNERISLAELHVVLIHHMVKMWCLSPTNGIAFMYLLTCLIFHISFGDLRQNSQHSFLQFPLTATVEIVWSETRWLAWITQWLRVNLNLDLLHPSPAPEYGNVMTCPTFHGYSKPCLGKVVETNPLK